MRQLRDQQEPDYGDQAAPVPASQQQALLELCHQRWDLIRALSDDYDILSGLTSVGQDEVVILLEVEEGETLPPREVFTMLQVLRFFLNLVLTNPKTSGTLRAGRGWQPGDRDGPRECGQQLSG